MYSVQHVLWRGAMALSLVVIGGLGAVSAPVVETEAGCSEPVTTAFAQAPVAAQAYRHVTFDTIVVHGTPALTEDA